MQGGCVAASEVVDRAIAGGVFARAAEDFILTHYLRHVGRTSVYPFNPYDFRDFTAGYANMTLFITFLEDHNPGLAPRLLPLRRQRGRLRIPDLLTDERQTSGPLPHEVGPRFRVQGPARTEYYEVKPNSVTGWADGAQKLVKLARMFNSLELPYLPGTSWAPNIEHTVYRGVLFGVQVEVYFHFFRRAPGLIVYEMCIRIDGLLELVQIMQIIAIVILMIVAKQRIPARAIRVPTLPVPEWIPQLI